MLQPCMMVDFPRWEEEDPTGSILCTKRYFRYYQMSDDAMVEITIIYLESDAIQWYNWLEYNHGALTWNQFKNALLNRFGPAEYENIDGQLAKIRQTSTIQEYQTRFQKLSYLAHDWIDRQLLGTFIKGLKPEIKWEVKAWQPRTIAIGRLLLIEPLEDVEEDIQEHEEEVTDEEEQPIDITMHALAGYVNP
ncbi:hypothetical protein BHE74_00049477 [Ensete ventricosum]|nr:hypothetical protein BHE74_00049477 [Ensete ventricosum]